MYGTLNGVYRMKEGKMHIHTFDTHSNGDIVMAIGTIDLIEGKASFTVYPERGRTEQSIQASTTPYFCSSTYQMRSHCKKPAYPRQPIHEWNKAPSGLGVMATSSKGAGSWCPGEDLNLHALASTST